MQTSAMLGLLAVALLVGPLLTGPLLLVLGFWAAVLLVVCWVGLLAAVDIWATRHHFSRLRHTYLVEEAKLHAEIRRLRAVRGNGKAEDQEEGES